MSAVSKQAVNEEERYGDEENCDSAAPLLPHSENDGEVEAGKKRTWQYGVLWFFWGQALQIIVGSLFTVLERNISVFQIIVMRSCIGLPLALTCMKILKVETVWGPKEVHLLCLTRAMLGSVSVTLTFSSLYFLPLGDMVALFRLNPVFTVLFGWLLKWEVINMIMAFGALGCVIGGVFITHPPFLFGGHEQWGIDRIIGIGMAGTAAVTSSIAFLAVGKIGRKTSPFNITMWFHSVSVVLAAPFLIAGFPKHVVWRMTLKEGGFIAVVSVASFFAQVMMTRGFQLMNAAMGSAFGSSQMLLSYLVGYFFLGEPFSVLTGVGIACIGMGIVVVAIGKHKSNK